MVKSGVYGNRIDNWVAWFLLLELGIMGFKY